MRDKRRRILDSTREVQDHGAQVTRRHEGPVGFCDTDLWTSQKREKKGVFTFGDIAGIEAKAEGRTGRGSPGSRIPRSAAACGKGATGGAGDGVSTLNGRSHREWKRGRKQRTLEATNIYSNKTDGVGRAAKRPKRLE